MNNINNLQQLEGDHPLCDFYADSTAKKKNQSEYPPVIFSPADLTMTSTGLAYKGNRLDPIFYKTCLFGGHIFWTNHYRSQDYYLDSEFAEKNRRRLIKRIIKWVKQFLGLNANDIQYFGMTEKKGFRCHTHTIIAIKKKCGDIADKVRSAIELFTSLTPQVTYDRATRQEANQIIINAVGVAAYISKINRNELECPMWHHSPKFFDYLEDHQKYGI